MRSPCSTGVGTVQHVSLELLNQKAGIKINHVPYKEMGSVRNDLFAGRIPLLFSNVPGTVALLTSKDVSCSGLYGHPSRSRCCRACRPFPAVIPGFETWEWNGLFAPAGTDPALISRLNGRGQRRDEDGKRGKGWPSWALWTQPNTVVEFTAFREKQIAFFAEMVKSADIRIE